MKMMNEFAFAISIVHFCTLRKWFKAISKAQADGATENTSPKGGDSIRAKYILMFIRAKYTKEHRRHHRAFKSDPY